MEEPKIFFVKRNYALALLIVFVAYSICYLMLFSGFIIEGRTLYFISLFGRRIAPIILLIGFLALSIVKGKGPINNLLSGVVGGALGLSLAVSIVVSQGYLNGTLFSVFAINADWNYIPVFEYCIFLVVGFFFIGKRLGFNYYSFFLVSLVTFATGFLYELPVYFTASAYAPIHIHHALFLEPTIIALFLLIFILYFNKVKIGKLQVITGLIFLGYSMLVFIFAANHYSCFHFPLPNNLSLEATLGIIVVVEGWLPRLPSFIFLLSLIYGVKNH